MCTSGTYRLDVTCVYLQEGSSGDYFTYMVYEVFAYVRSIVMPDFSQAPPHEYSSSPKIVQATSKFQNLLKIWMLVWGEADSETSTKRSLKRKLFKTCCMNWGELIQLMHTTMVPEQVKTMKIQAGVQVSRQGELRRHLQLWKCFGRLYFIVIVLVRTLGEEERNNDNDVSAGDDIEKPTRTDSGMPVNEAENGIKNEPIKKAEKEEMTEAPIFQPVKYYMKHRINKKLIEGLVDNHRFNDSLSGARVRKIKGRTYNLLPRGVVYEAVLGKKITRKEDIGGNFEIPCNIGGLKHMNALVDQGSDVNFMPLSIYMKLTDERPAETDIKLSLASHSYIYPLGIAEDVLVEVVEHVYPIDFVILDIKENEKRPFILGTPFLTTAKAVIKFDKGTITLRSRKNKISFNRIPESLCKDEKWIKNDIEPIAPTMTVNRLVLEWEEKIKLHQEKEMEFDRWRNKNFKNERPAPVKIEDEVDDEGEVTARDQGTDIKEMDKRKDKTGQNRAWDRKEREKTRTTYSVIHHPPQETSKEILQAREDLMEAIQAFLNEFDHIPPEEKCMDLLLAEERFLKIKQAMEEELNQPEFSMIDDVEVLMKDIYTFLRKFSRIPFGVTPKVILIAWERFGEIKHALTDEQYQQEDIQELISKLLEDVQNISEELSEYINCPSWNRPTFYDDDDDEYTIIYRKPKAITPDLSTVELDNSLSMGDEHLDTIPSVEILVPIPIEFEGISDDTCDVPVCEDSSTFDALNDNSKILSDSNNDDTLSDDDDFEDIGYVSLEEVNDVDQEEKDFDLEDILQIQDVILREKLLNISRLITNIESLNDNPTPDHVFKSPFSFPIPVTDSDSFFEKSDTSFSHLDNSLPEFKPFSDDTEETRSGSTTTHANNSLPDSHSLTLLEFARRLGLYQAVELEEEGFNVYFEGGLRSDEHFNAQDYWLRISREENLGLSRSHTSTIKNPILRVIYKMITYGLCQRTTGYDKIQKNDLWLLSIFDARYQNGYANVAWLIARWMKRKGSDTQKERQICCGQFISKIARKGRVLTEDVVRSLSALIYYRDLDTTTLRDLIDL
ncbi:zinc finger, CCHC-type containing protein [Tanacetum coccineum]